MEYGYCLNRVSTVIGVIGVIGVKGAIGRKPLTCVNQDSESNCTHASSYMLLICTKLNFAFFKQNSLFLSFLHSQVEK